MANGMSSHQKSVGDSQVWLTPPYIIAALGEFDLDPASPQHRIWETAKAYYTQKENGLAMPWFGRVWLNPPYDRRYIDEWMKKMAGHNNGIALVFARTETRWFQQFVFPTADSILFIDKRLTFYRQDGTLPEGNSGAPSVLIAYNEDNTQALYESKIEGHFLPLNTNVMVVVGTSPSWKDVVSISMTRLRGYATVKDVYDAVGLIAPDKVQGNKNFKAKIRQTLQYHFTRTDRGRYTNQ